MKTAQLILQYLAAAKKVSLQHLGTLYLAPEFSMADPEKELSFPEGAVSFSYDPKAGNDEDLIAFIMQQTKKIKPLASSDLESYLHLGKQFLNLGKPFILEGLGSLQKNASGEIVFSHQSAGQLKPETVSSDIKEKASSEISFASQPKKKNYWKTWVPVGLILIFLTGSVLYYFMGGKQEKEVQVIEPRPKPVVTATPPAEKPEIAVRSDVNAPVPESALVEVSTFRIVLKQYYDSNRARKFFNLIKNSHPNLEMYAFDSTRYNVAVRFTLPLADTLKVRDSLVRLVGLRAWIDLSKR